MRTKITLLSPRPNQIRAIGNSAIDGNGLNIDVRISRKSAPIRVALANAVNSPAKISPARYPFRSRLSVKDTAANKRPLEIDETSATTVAENVGKRSGLSSHRAYVSHAAASTARSTIFRKTLLSNMHGSSLHLSVR